MRKKDYLPTCIILFHFFPMGSQIVNSINAATLALAHAGIPMRDLATSCSAGYLNNTPLLALNYVEDSAGGPDVSVGILSKTHKVTLLQMDAKLPMETFETVMQLAVEGCKAIANYIREVLQRKHQATGVLAWCIILHQ